MNRRDFFKKLTAIAVAASIPISIVADLESGSLKGIEGISFVRAKLEFFDYGQTIGLAVIAKRNEKTLRHGVALDLKDWNEFDETQREDVWRIVENHLIKKMNS